MTKPKFVVGLGASAGGLEALQSFFTNVPEASQAAYIVVQHLSPDFRSLMDQLLRRFTNINIKLAEDGLEVESNSIYLIPPKTNMTIDNHNLHLTQQERNHRLNFPIDIFLKSLAKEYKEHSIAVILSGTGSDGTEGVKAIAEAGGLVLAQDPQEAKFDGMPTSAINTKVVTKTLSTSEMPSLIEAYLQKTAHPPKPIQQSTTEDHYEAIFTILERKYSINFRNYKETTIYRRISRRANALLITKMGDYVARLKTDDLEAERLYLDLLIGVTYFFRDPDIFKYFETNVVPGIFANNVETKSVKVWVAGCATGEEVYSIAILLKEYSETLPQAYEIKIFATDINSEALRVASRGIYSQSQLADIPPNRLEYFFVKQGEDYHIKSEIRNMVVYTNHNVFSDPPFTQVDLVVCRNLLIYLKPEIQNKALSAFTFSLKKQGTLFLGPSESLGHLDESYHIENPRFKIFTKTMDQERTPVPFSHPVSLKSPIMASRSSKKKFTLGDYDQIISSILKDSLIINEKDEVFHITGKATKYIAYGQGPVSNSIQDILHDNLKAIVTAGIFRTRTENTTAMFTKVPWVDGEHIDITIYPVLKPQKDETFLTIISFNKHDTKITHTHYSNQVDNIARDLEQQLAKAKQELRESIESAETTNEELQSTNEELLASNEELQSTNEELHSVNEELFSVNAEFQNKIEELSILEYDLNNISEATELTVIVVDRSLIIKRITPRVSQIFGILKRDLGRNISLFSQVFGFKNLLSNIESVISEGKGKKLDSRKIEGKQFALRIEPYVVRGETTGSILEFLDTGTQQLGQDENRRYERLPSFDPFDGFVHSATQYIDSLIDLVDDCRGVMPQNQITPDIEAKLTKARHVSQKLVEYNNIKNQETIKETILFGDCLNKVLANNDKIVVNENIQSKMPIYSNVVAVTQLLTSLIDYAYNTHDPEQRELEIGGIQLTPGYHSIYIRNNDTMANMDDFNSQTGISHILNEGTKNNTPGFPFCRLLAKKAGAHFWAEVIEGTGLTIYLSFSDTTPDS